MQQVQSGEVIYTGTIQTLRYVLKNEGVPGLYKGLAPNLIRVAPAAAITFFSYEHILSRVNSFLGSS